MSVNKEYMSLYRDFFDGVDMAGVSDLSEADKEYKAIDFGKAILAINKSLKESIPSSENALKELAEKLLEESDSPIDKGLEVFETLLWNKKEYKII